MLIVTYVSDVKLTFDGTEALILPEATAESLVRTILNILTKPGMVSKISANGREKSLLTFDSGLVGKRVVNFITNC